MSNTRNLDNCGVPHFNKPQLLVAAEHVEIPRMDYDNSKYIGIYWVDLDNASL